MMFLLVSFFSPSKIKQPPQKFFDILTEVVIGNHRPPDTSSIVLSAEGSLIVLLCNLSNSFS